MASRTSTEGGRRGRTAATTNSGRSLVLTLGFASVLFASLAVSGCSSQPKAAAPEPAATQTQPAATEPTTQATPAPAATALKIEDIKVGTGAEAKTGDTVTVNYTGYLTDGTKFDSSLDSGQPFKFKIGEGKVIAGWEQGFAGMKVGGMRKLTIPPELGYGAQGAGGVIPPNATLVFDVELLAVN
jgi:FKBP-type peptidyl-prolyl cis-trans isomerase